MQKMVRSKTKMKYTYFTKKKKEWILFGTHPKERMATD